jgi:hypothetical protein
MRYLKLAGGYLKPLSDKMVERGEVALNPILSVGFVAVDDEDIIRAEIVIQSVCMVEPAKADEGYGNCLAPLFRMANDFIQESGVPRVIMHTEHRGMAAMLRRAKAKLWPVTMYQWYRKEG